MCVRMICRNDNGMILGRHHTFNALLGNLPQAGRISKGLSQAQCAYLCPGQCAWPLCERRAKKKVSLGDSAVEGSV